ncbi:DUF6115 domain-containing protein [Desulfoluna butyratoxydans]|uniref:DUF2802 domain-containing protein n=1 Tax=Desulfoluna butyratoxydans TaxID=231438 RepID=A0A4U8YGS8_9BACT|nr:DUF742 domain-containing protein [Desulfoluna butyratoxydans]VFQ42626.1 protein of unknown function duf742 [Desulfoluna butyratoxydans]
MTLYTMLAFLLFGLGTACLALALSELIQTRRTRQRLEAESVRAAHTRVLSLLEPVLSEAKAVADAFDGHVAEKRLIVTELNQSLEKRIASLKLHLNRADALMARQQQTAAEEENAEQRISESRQRIVQLAAKGLSVDEIAERLTLPKGEVALVVGLRGGR